VDPTGNFFGKLTITGSGSLICTGGRCTNSSYNGSCGIAANNLTISGADVTATSGTGSDSYGIFSCNTLSVNNGGILTAIGHRSAFSSMSIIVPDGVAYYVNTTISPSDIALIGDGSTTVINSYLHRYARIDSRFTFITTPTGVLSEGTVGRVYNATITAVNSPASWAVSSGALPGGLTLNNSGVISGIPAEAGTFTFEVTATNSYGTSAAVTFNITVLPLIAVTGITDVPTEVAFGVPLNLRGTVAPEDATNQDIVWSIQSAGTTGATIWGDVLFTNTTGTVVVTATIARGLAVDMPYTQNFDIAVRNSAGLEDISSPLVRAYPNPTTGQITIDNLQFTIESVEVFDLYGKKIVNCPLSIHNTIDISHLPAGLYLLRIDSGKRQTNLKIVKK
jgi:hypothetical protein